MKYKLLSLLLTIIIGVLFTFYYLNKTPFLAKSEYNVVALQVGAFKNIDNANNILKNYNSHIIVKEDQLYKVYIAIYKNIDLLNKMLIYYDNNNINVYVKNIKVESKFFYEIDNYEKILLNSEDSTVYNKVNQSILDLYLESNKNGKNN